MITEYGQIARGPWPQFATDLASYRMSSGPVVWVSLADIATQKARGKLQIPMRNREGERLACVWDRMKGKRADNFAKTHGWPFTIHLANIEAQQEAIPAQETGK